MKLQISFPGLGDVGTHNCLIQPESDCKCLVRSASDQKSVLQIGKRCKRATHLCRNSVMLSCVPSGTARLTNSRRVPGRPEILLTSIASLCMAERNKSIHTG